MAFQNARFIQKWREGKKGGTQMWQSFDILEMTPTGFFLLNMNNLQIFKYHKKERKKRLISAPC